MDNKNYSKTTQKFYCEKCDYVCSNSSNYQKHLLTQKHLRILVPFAIFRAARMANWPQLF